MDNEDQYIFLIEMKNALTKIVRLLIIVHVCRHHSTQNAGGEHLAVTLLV
jgi:hypothetical protein